jgi:gamma-glutamyltranspeptidase
VNALDFGTSAKETLGAPRIHTEGAEPIQVSGNTSEQAVSELRKRGHEVAVKPALGGAANAIILRKQGRELDAADSAGPGGVLVF